MSATKRQAAVLAAATAILTVGVGVGPASASLSQCASGETCGWAATEYSDIRFEAEFDISILSPGQDNVADSVANHGNLDCVWFYARSGYTGESIRFNRPGLGGTYRDPNLSNGGGAAGHTTENWANRISSVGLYRC